MPRQKETRRAAKALGRKMDDFLSTSLPAPEQASGPANANAPLATTGTTEPNFEDSCLTASQATDQSRGLSSENMRLLEEMRHMIQKEVRGEICKVGADVLTIKEVLEMLTAEVNKLGNRVTEIED